LAIARAESVDFSGSDAIALSASNWLKSDFTHGATLFLERFAETLDLRATSSTEDSSKDQVSIVHRQVGVQN